MALPPDTNVAFLREVDDEVRRDRLTNFWTKWGLWSIAGVVAALALLGGFLFWQHRSREAAGRGTEGMPCSLVSVGGQSCPEPPVRHGISRTRQDDPMERTKDDEVLDAVGPRLRALRRDRGITRPARGRGRPLRAVRRMRPAHPEAPARSRHGVRQ